MVLPIRTENSYVVYNPLTYPPNSSSSISYLIISFSSSSSLCYSYPPLLFSFSFSLCSPAADRGAAERRACGRRRGRAEGRQLAARPRGGRLAVAGRAERRRLAARPRGRQRRLARRWPAWRRPTRQAAAAPLPEGRRPAQIEDAFDFFLRICDWI